MSEHKEQCAVIKWAAWEKKKHPELVNLFAIPNGEKRDIATAVKLKAEGVLAGVPDLFLAAPRGAFAGLFLEMKIKPNKPTEKQLEVMANLQAQNYDVHVCYSSKEAINVIENYLKGKRWDYRDLLAWIAQKHTTTE